MLKKRTNFLWITCLVTAATCVASESRDSSRVLNPYHEQQLQEQIQKCASGVMACSDAEQRCLKQQELPERPGPLPRSVREPLRWPGCWRRYPPVSRFP